MSMRLQALVASCASLALIASTVDAAPASAGDNAAAPSETTRASLPEPPQRERDFVQIIQDARTEMRTTRASYKDIRLQMQMRVQTFYETSHEFEGWIGSVNATRVLDKGDMWISIKIADGISVSTSPSHADDPEYQTLIRGGSKLANVAAKLVIGQKVSFSATLLRFVGDSDEDMIKTPRLLVHFNRLEPLN